VPAGPFRYIGTMKKLQRITVMHEGRPVRLIGYLERGTEPGTPDTFTVLSKHEQRQLDRRVQDGTEAWKRIKAADLVNFYDWLQVAEAFEIGQEACMAEARKDEPEGGAYARLFNGWLERNGFDDLDQGARQRALAVLRNRASIEEWRSTLEPVARLRVNHPQSVLRGWKKWLAQQQQQSQEPSRGQ
jgi:hypothetical protein